MSAFIRIYTRFGKENICTAEAYRLNVNTIKFYGTEDDLNCVNHIIKAGQPCNVHIRYEDQEIETECRLEGVCIRDDNSIQYETSNINIIRYKGIK